MRIAPSPQTDYARGGEVTAAAAPVLAQRVSDTMQHRPRGVPQRAGAWVGARNAANTSRECGSCSAVSSCSGGGGTSLKRSLRTAVLGCLVALAPALMGVTTASAQTDPLGPGTITFDVKAVLQQVQFTAFHDEVLHGVFEGGRCVWKATASQPTGGSPTTVVELARNDSSCLDLARVGNGSSTASSVRPQAGFSTTTNSRESAASSSAADPCLRYSARIQWWDPVGIRVTDATSYSSWCTDYTRITSCGGGYNTGWYWEDGWYEDSGPWWNNYVISGGYSCYNNLSVEFYNTPFCNGTGVDDWPINVWGNVDATASYSYSTWAWGNCSGLLHYSLTTG
jgi:hypothetical protein